MSDILPMYSEEHQLGDKGIRIIDEIVSGQLKWVFREQPKNDFGIDAFVEIITDEGKATGRLIAFQIKCGHSFFKEQNDDGYIYRGESKHINYWINHSLPVIITISNPDTRETHWVEVTRSNSKILPDGWKIVIPKNQILNVAHKSKVRTIAGQIQEKDIIELLLFRFLYEKYGETISIFPPAYTPHDFHGLPYLIRLNGSIQYVAFYYAHFNLYDTEEILKILNLRDSNDDTSGNYGAKTNLNLFFVADTIENLKIPVDILALVKSYTNVEIFNLIYENKQLFDDFRSIYVVEVDKDYNMIDFY